MSAEQTSSLTFADLQTRVAVKLGLAHYGDDGDGPPEPPIDTHDAAEVKRLVNDGLRMFFADAPLRGWRFARTRATIDIWPDIPMSAERTVSGVFDSPTNRTTLTFDTLDVFESMEDKEITLDGIGTFRITLFVDNDTLIVEGDATATDVQWSITGDETYTMPRGFHGQFTNTVTYAEDTDNFFTGLTSVSEAKIRSIKAATATQVTTQPSIFAIRRRRNAYTGPRRRWEMMVYPNPDKRYQVIIEFDYLFDLLVEPEESAPVPATMDDAVLAAALAIAERRVADVPGESDAYYRGVALPNAQNADTRSAPRTAGSLPTNLPPQNGSGDGIGSLLNHQRTSFDVTLGD